MLEKCIELNNEFIFFQNLLLDILTRRTVFKKFEDEVKKTNLTKNNNMMSLVWFGYVVLQLSDCRKFFDRNGNAHSLKFVVSHVKDRVLKEKHLKLFKIWQNKKLETVINKYLLHADMRFSQIETEVFVSELDYFVDELEEYIKEILTDLSKNYSEIDGLAYDVYLSECKVDVDVFLDQFRKSK